MFAPITARTKSPSTKHEVKQDWEKLYRAAIIESDRSKLLQRVEDTDAAILERSRSLSMSPANGEANVGYPTEASCLGEHCIIFRSSANKQGSWFPDPGGFSPVILVS